MTSFNFRVVLCRIRIFPILNSKIKRLGCRLPLKTDLSQNKHVCIRIKQNQTYRIIGLKQEDSSKVSVNSGVIPTLIYNEATPRFHQWRAQGTVYGLNFASAEMASDFAHEMKIALQYVKGELEWPQGQSQPPPPPIQPVAPRPPVQPVAPRPPMPPGGSGPPRPPMGGAPRPPMGGPPRPPMGGPPGPPPGPGKIKKM